MSQMILAGKLYQKSVLERLKEIDWDFGSKSPFVVELDPTTACDLACPGCISGSLLNKKGSYDNRFSDQRLLEITDELITSGVKAVVLIGGGEPLSHPKIGEVIKKFGENDVQIGITTNGTFISKHLDVIAKHATWTRVSVDAGTDETFRQLRPAAGGQSRFEKVTSNMRALSAVKKGILGFSFLIRTEADGIGDRAAGQTIGRVGTSNVSEIYQAAVLAKELGCDYFELKPSYDDDHNLVTHSAEDMDLASSLLEKCKSLEDDNFRIMESVNLQPALLREGIGDQPKDYVTCPTAELRTLITPSGVYVCPYFRGLEKMKLGDLREEGFQSMWNGERRKGIMEQLNPSLTCSGLHCIRHETNRDLINIQKKIRSETPIDTVVFDKEDRFI